MGGRFLQRLEEGVGRARRAEAHPLGVEDDRDLERRDEGAQVKLAFEFADLIDGDVARLRFRPEGVEIGMLLRRTGEDLPRQPERKILQRLGAVARQQIGMPHPSLLNAGGESLAKFFSAERHGKKVRRKKLEGRRKIFVVAILHVPRTKVALGNAS